MSPYVKDRDGRNCVSIGEAAKRKGVTKEAIRQAIKRGVLEWTEVRYGNLHMHLIPMTSLATYTPSASHTGQREAKAVSR